MAQPQSHALYMESLFSYLHGDLENELKSEPIQSVKKEEIQMIKLRLKQPHKGRTTTPDMTKLVSGLIGHSVGTMTKINGKNSSRPNWHMVTHWAIQLIREYETFHLASLSHVRAGAIGSENLVSRVLDSDGDAFSVKMDYIMDLEEQGRSFWQRHCGRYPIPKEQFNESIMNETTRIEKESNNIVHLDGEWSYPSSLWTQLNPFATPTMHKARKVILYLHGGAFVFGSPRLFRIFTLPLARETGFPVFCLNYRLAPEHPFPAALHDALAAYMWLLNPRSSMFQSDSSHHEPYLPEDIIIAGDSAGGSLCMALLNYINQYLRTPDGGFGVPLPAGAVLLSPWLDLACSSDSYAENEAYDVIPAKLRDLHEPITESFEHPVHHYCFGKGERELEILTPKALHFSELQPLSTLPDKEPLVQDTMERLLRHPLISPIYGNMEKLCPILVQAGDAELLRDETQALAFKFKLANKGTQHWMLHELYTDMVHDFQLAPLPSSRLAMKRIKQFTHHVFCNESLESIQPREASMVTVTFVGPE